jgi:hypothetical protein
MKPMGLMKKILPKNLRSPTFVDTFEMDDAIRFLMGIAVIVGLRSLTRPTIAHILNDATAQPSPIRTM